jgi:hypothetical protein
MHGLTLTTWLVTVAIGLADASPTGTATAVEVAQRQLASGHAAAAVALLEDALPTAGNSRDAVLNLLKTAYAQAATQAEAAGKPRAAETFRENLRILGRKTKPEATAAAPVAPTQRLEPAPAPARVPEVEAPQPVADPALADRPEPAFGGEPPATQSIPATPDPRTSSKAPVEPEPTPLLTLPSAPPPADVAAADAAFAAEQYDEAGKIYAQLALDRRLPTSRRDHWAYCRSVAVARRINARPRTEAEWASIDAEIEQIRALNPENWLGEYLRNRAAERVSYRRKPAAGQTVVRASSPDEPVVDRPVRPASNTPPPAAPAAAAAPATSPSVPNPAAARIGTAVGRWQTKETANFRIFHGDPALADQVAQAAEATRREQTLRWTGVAPKGVWQPKCEIYLYPSPHQYAQMTGQPEDSPGFSTMGMNEGRVITRRVNLRADHPNLVAAVLPHEITHVILADLFTFQQIPRWADEGMAVLSEPAEEQRKRSGDLADPLSKNLLFTMESLMGMDYPDQKYWGLYYAQSVSLTRFLVEQGTPAQLVDFLQGAQRNGVEVELRRVYQIDGFADLQKRWVTYARTLPEIKARTAAATRPAPAADVRVR